MSKKDDCLVCKTNAEIEPEEGKNRDIIICPRCGTFIIDRIVPQPEIKNLDNNDLFRFALSHWIRIHQSKSSVPNDSPHITEELYTSLKNTLQLPKPKEQSRYCIKMFGSKLKTWDDYLLINDEYRNLLPSIIGTKDANGVLYILDYLITKEIIREEVPNERDDSGFPASRLGLTFKGWSKFDLIMKHGIRTNFAFLALDYNSPDVEKFAREHLACIIHKHVTCATSRSSDVIKNQRCEVPEVFEQEQNVLNRQYE